MARGSRNVSGVVVGIATVIGTAAIARRLRSRTEIRLFRLANGLPGRAYERSGFRCSTARSELCPWPRNRAGSASAASRTGDRRGGNAAWVAAKAAKPIVDRGRPPSMIEGVVERGAEEGDQGPPGTRRSPPLLRSSLGPTCRTNPGLWPRRSPGSCLRPDVRRGAPTAGACRGIGARSGDRLCRQSGFPAREEGRTDGR
jgi:hypothetical protein